MYSKGLAVDPTNVFCLRSLGEVERVDGRQAQARDYLERALDLEPGNKFVLKVRVGLIFSESIDDGRVPILVPRRAHYRMPIGEPVAT